MPEPAATDHSPLQRFFAGLPPGVPQLRAHRIRLGTNASPGSPEAREVLVVVGAVEEQHKVAIYQAAWAAGFAEVLLALRGGPGAAR